MKLLLLIFACYFINTLAQFECSGKPLGYYCQSDKDYYWCYDNAVMASKFDCPKGTTCVCDYSSENPCALTGTTMECSNANEPVAPVKPETPVEPTAPVKPETPVEPTTPVQPDTPVEPTAPVQPDTPVEPTAPVQPVAPVAPTSCPQPPAQSSKKFISYFTNWAQYRNGACKFTGSNVLPIFTHINFAFAKVSADYKVEAFEWNDEGENGNFQQVNNIKKSNPNIKTLISIGGWNFNFFEETKAIFTTMAADQSFRTTFINSAISFAREHNFDGVDLDWEYPADSEQGGRPEDTINFTTLLKEFRDAIENEQREKGVEKLLLTIAAPAGERVYKNIQLDKIHTHLDWINLMTYDLHGSWESTTGLHTALYCVNNDPLCIDKAVTAYLEAGVPSEKLILGLATYGRSFTLQTPGTNDIGAPAIGGGRDGTCTAQSGMLAYYEIQDVLNAGGATEVCDESAKACYLYKDNLWVGYDNEKSMTQKVQYINSKKLGGAMVWAMDLDGPRGSFNTLQCVISRNLFSGSTQESSPATNAPTTSEKETPATSEKEAPATSEKEAPTTSEKEAPTTSEKEAPTTSEKEAPTTSEKEAPTTSEKEAPSTGETTDEKSTTDQSDVPYSRKPSEYLPYALTFDLTKLEEQVNDLLSKESYDNAQVYSPASLDKVHCSFRPPQHYDTNLNQMLIGRPSETTSISNTPGITMRLPDKYLGLFLAYAMDMYGLNPSMLLGLAAKESFMPALYATDDDSYFIVNDEAAFYDCYAAVKEGLCTDNNLDGPFQVETPSMSTDVSVFAHRFYTGDLDVPKDNRTPEYLNDASFANLPNFRELHDSYTKDLYRAVVLTSLDFHFRFNVMVRLAQSGVPKALDARSDRKDKEALLFAAAMYTYNRGIYGKEGLSGMLESCGLDKDPIRDCGLDGYGGHSRDIQQACHLVDTATEVYDYRITWNDVDWFLEKLESTYPYHEVENFYLPIDWASMEKDVKKIYDILAAHRKQVDPKNGDGISFRYDWRTLLAVVRAYLPEKEVLVGPTLKDLDNFYGNDFVAEYPPYVDAKSIEADYVSTAGSKYKAKHISEAQQGERPELEETSSAVQMSITFLLLAILIIVNTIL